MGEYLKNKVSDKLQRKFGHLNCDGMTKLKTSEIIDRDLTIIDFDFGVAPKTGEIFPVVIFKELPNCFYFGGMVLGDLLTDIQQDEQAMREIVTDGLRIKIAQKMSKNNRAYTMVELV